MTSTKPKSAPVRKASASATAPAAPKPAQAVHAVAPAVKSKAAVAAVKPKPAAKPAISDESTMAKAIEKTAQDVSKVVEKLAEAPVEAAKAVVAAAEVPSAPVKLEPIKLKPVLKPVSVEAPVSLKVVPASIPPKPVSKMVNKMASAMPSMPFKGYEEMAAFSKANMDAVIQANQILAKGFEEISKEMMSVTQSSIEHATAAAKAMFGVKSLKDAMELNAGYSKSAFDKFVADSTKLSELGVKVATDAFAPVTARVHLAVEKVVKPTHA